MCGSVHVRAGARKKPQRGMESSRGGVTGGYKLLDVGTGNQTWTLLQNQSAYLTAELSSQSTLVINSKFWLNFAFDPVFHLLDISHQ